jgi:hypothetical protein
MFVSFAILTLLCSPFLINTSQAQPIQPQPSQSKLPSLSSTTPSSPSKIHGVKITSPTKTEQVPVGKDLSITGTSLANASSNCQVFVIANHLKPYQPATATGPGGAKDYSKWNFVLTSKYTPIKPGPNNKITAKYSCTNNPSVVSYNSVNVTGVVTAYTSSATIQQEQRPPVTLDNSTSTSTDGPSVLPGMP